MTTEQIIAATAAHFGRTVEELLGRDRHHPLAEQRQIAMYLCRELTDLSVTTIGESFYRDHTTVLYAEHKIRRTSRADVCLSVKSITSRLLEMAAS